MDAAWTFTLDKHTAQEVSQVMINAKNFIMVNFKKPIYFRFLNLGLYSLQNIFFYKSGNEYA